MSGTAQGGQKTAATNKKRYGKDYYKVIGSLGGKKGTTGGFYGSQELARLNGKLGGMRSRSHHKGEPVEWNEEMQKIQDQINELKQR